MKKCFFSFRKDSHVLRNTLYVVNRFLKYRLGQNSTELKKDRVTLFYRFVVTSELSGFSTM